MKNFGMVSAKRLVTVMSLAFIAAGCGSGAPSYSLLSTGQSFTQSNNGFNNQLDILWVVDNSGSMGPLQTTMTNNFSSFITNFQTKGYDFKMAVTTSDAYLADSTLNGYKSANAALAKYRDGSGSAHSGIFVMTPLTSNLTNVFVTDATQGSSGSGDERVFSSFRTSLNYNQSPNAGFLRSTSFFAIIILSDEDDFSGNGRCENCGNDHDYGAVTLDTVASYESYLDTLTQSAQPTRRWNANAITVLDSTCLAQHQQQSSSSIIGQRYIQMANDTSGILGSVCDASYANSLGNIAQNIAELSTQFFLAKIPIVSTIVITVNSALVPQDPSNGWTYISATNAIMFHGAAVPPQNAVINVQFTPNGVNH